MKPAVINRKTLFWTGEHWINFLRRSGEEAHSGMVSLYHTHYSAAGAGIVALVHVDAPQRFTAICTDNRELVPFIQEHWPRGRIPPFDGPDVPVLDATFRRGGDIRCDPGWIITVEGHEIVARWMVTQPPLVMTRAGAGQMTRQKRTIKWRSVVRFWRRHADLDMHSALFFTDEAAITFDGQPADGLPYLSPHWAPLLGTARSSCVFALAETMMQ